MDGLVALEDSAALLVERAFLHGILSGSERAVLGLVAFGLGVLLIVVMALLVLVTGRTGRRVACSRREGLGIWSNFHHRRRTFSDDF